MNGLFDVFDLPDTRSDPDGWIGAALARRRRMKDEGRYADADAVRSELADRGVVLEDTAQGTRWWIVDPPR